MAYNWLNDFIAVAGFGALLAMTLYLADKFASKFRKKKPAIKPQATKI